MTTRRHFLGAMSWPAAAAAATTFGLRPEGIVRALAAVSSPARDVASPEALARDESFWFDVQQAFDVDRSMINLNNGGVCPSPRAVMSALHRHLDFSNTAPAYAMWQVLEPRREAVRSGLARVFGCDAEEVAITRNASESLQILQLGLDLERGDEILTTNQDYPRMIATWKQRGRREGIEVRQFSIPVPCEDPAAIVRAFEERIGPRTRALLMCHVINLTGQILPVREVVRAARRRGVPVIVDGAHAFAHLAFTREDLDCDTYAASLHKWLSAPIGTGLLYVRRDRIKEFWPLMAAPPEMDSNIRKFEEIGTHPAAPVLGIAEALTFHDGIGARAKAARLVFLRDRWARRLLDRSDRVRLHTSLEPGFAGGLACVQIDGIDSTELNAHLWDRHRIFTTAIRHEEFEGLRISPNVYTTLDEIDRFGDAVEDVVRNGLPKS